MPSVVNGLVTGARSLHHQMKNARYQPLGTYNIVELWRLIDSEYNHCVLTANLAAGEQRCQGGASWRIKVSRMSEEEKRRCELRSCFPFLWTLSFRQRQAALAWIPPVSRT